MWTNRQFWMDATWRCFRTFCQTLAAMLAGQTANLLSAPWTGMLSTAGGAALVSLLMSIDRERVVTPGEVTALAPSISAPVKHVTDPQAMKRYVTALQSNAARLQGQIRAQEAASRQLQKTSRHLAVTAEPTFEPPRGCGGSLQ